MMDNATAKITQSTSITILPENYSSIVSAVRSKRSRSFLLGALLLFFGGLVSYGWWFYQDWRFKADGRTVSATIDAWSTEKSSGKGGVRYTNTIHYQYESESAERFFGSDSVKTWRHKPESNSGVRPSENDDILVEYLKASPNTSRIVIPNRYSTEYFLSKLAMVLSGVLLLILLITSLSTKQQLQCFGGLLVLLGLAIMLFFIGLIFDDEQVKRPGDIWWMLLGLATIPIPFSGAAIWYGWFLISRAQFNFRDPLEVLNTQWIPQCGDRITIVPRAFLGTDAAIVLDHQSRKIHFLNCHVSRGFIPQVMRAYSCEIPELRIEEKTYSSKQGQVTYAIVSSSAGATRLGMHEPGVAELVHILRNPG